MFCSDRFVCGVVQVYAFAFRCRVNKVEIMSEMLRVVAGRGSTVSELALAQTDVI